MRTDFCMVNASFHFTAIWKVACTLWCPNGICTGWNSRCWLAHTILSSPWYLFQSTRFSRFNLLLRREKRRRMFLCSSPFWVNGNSEEGLPRGDFCDPYRTAKRSLFQFHGLSILLFHRSASDQFLEEHLVDVFPAKGRAFGLARQLSLWIGRQFPSSGRCGFLSSTIFQERQYHMLDSSNSLSKSTLLWSKYLLKILTSSFTFY